MIKCCYSLFWMYGSKNILFMLPLIKKQKSHKLPNFSYPVSKKCWPQQKLWYLAKNVPTIWCRPVCSIFVHNFVTIEQKIKKWTRRGGSPMDPFPPTYLTSKKPNSCSVKEADRCKPCGGNSSSCQLCGSDKNTSIFESKYCNQVYQTKENFKYNSKLVVYLIGCRVFRNHNGSTTTKFRARANNYKRTYRNFSKEQILSNQVRNQKLFREHICTMTLTGFVIRRS